MAQEEMEMSRTRSQKDETLQIVKLYLSYMDMRHGSITIFCCNSREKIN